MNIFYLHRDPVKAATVQYNKHVVKMILETAQLLCGVHHTTDQVTDQIPYKLSHKNHPCAIWSRESLSNYLYLCDFGLELCKEYTYRYGKIHACARLKDVLANVPKNISIGSFTPPTPAMPDECKIANNSLASYHKYYIEKKVRFAKWTNREEPLWYSNAINTNNANLHIL